MSYTARQTTNKAVPERSQTERGAACPETLKRPGGVQIGDPSGPEIGPTENAKTRQEHGDAVREARGVRTRPARPGRHI
jgi:hypothetical protein